MITRGQVLFSGVALGVLGAPLLTQFVAAATNATADDLGILNSALELELAAIKAYADAAATKLLSKEVLAVALGFQRDHQAHRDALTAAVTAGGGKPSTKPALLEYPVLKTQSDILHFAKSVEEKAASTYLSVISEFTDRRLAQAAASILGVETTHVALLAQVLGELPAYKSGFVA
ncbi:MAG: ferritin-like domain-containing protein [Candidatus Eremiobacteraeota bacterium]|nr:ferritin-like domain-containing protein [Candidatus Eremiobacteraeota bacterium]